MVISFAMRRSLSLFPLYEKKLAPWYAFAAFRRFSGMCSATNGERL